VGLSRQTREFDGSLNGFFGAILQLVGCVTGLGAIFSRVPFVALPSVVASAFGEPAKELTPCTFD
jgi:hypothetical protein